MHPTPSSFGFIGGGGFQKKKKKHLKKLEKPFDLFSTIKSAISIRIQSESAG